MRGGQGDDSVSGGAGNDFISGDRGNDTEMGGGNQMILVGVSMSSLTASSIFFG